MCLAIPGKILDVAVDSTGLRMGRVDFGGIVKRICLEYTPDALPGDYVLVHVGFALSRIDAEEAARTYAALKELGELEELEEAEEPGGTRCPQRVGDADRGPTSSDEVARVVPNASIDADRGPTSSALGTTRATTLPVTEDAT